MTIQSVPLEKAYRLLNHGPTVLVSAQHDKDNNVMTAAWACALEFSPAKVTVVLDKMTYTRKLIEHSGYFALQIPVARQAKMVLGLGSVSRHQYADKLTQHGVELFYQPSFNVPLVKGCAAWLICELIPEPHNQQQHDLFIGRVVGAWADDCIFKDGHWQFEHADDDWRTLHYVAGGHFYCIGQAMDISVE